MAGFSLHRGPWRLHLAMCLVAFCGLALVPAFLQSFHAELAGSGVERALVRLLDPVAWVKTRTGLGLVPQMWLAAALIPLAMLVVIGVFEVLVGTWRLDPANDAWTSLVWSARSWLGWLQWLGIVVLSVAVGSLALLLPGAWSLVGLVPVVAALLTSSFYAGNAANLRPARPPSRWRMRWPGWFAVVTAVASMLLAAAIDRGIDALALSPVADVVVDLALWLPALVVAVFVRLVWLDRARIRGVGVAWRKAVALRVLAATFVQQLRLGAIFVPLMLPVAPLAALLIFVVPQVEDFVQRAEGGLGPFWSTWVAGARLFGSFWWVLVLPLFWFVSVAASRLLLQLGAVSADPPPARG